MLISSFLNYLQYEKRYSSHTIQAYQADIKQFEEFIQWEFDLQIVEVQASHIRSYLMDRLKTGMLESALNRKLSSLRSFYKFLLRDELVKSNPVVLVKAPKIPKRLPVFVETAKMNQLLDGVLNDEGDIKEYFTEDFKGQRDKIVIEFLFGTGVRLAELLMIKDTDINTFEGTVKVLGKRNKERIIPLHKTLLESIGHYLKLKSIENFNNKSTSLIVTNKGDAAYAKFIYRVVKGYLTEVSTQDKKSPHVLRHSFASTLLDRGADLNAIKELLGHASLAATQVYTHNSVERLKSIYKQAHPKA